MFWSVYWNYVQFIMKHILNCSSTRSTTAVRILTNSPLWTSFLIIQNSKMKSEKNYQTKPQAFGWYRLQFVFPSYRRNNMGTKFLSLFWDTFSLQIILSAAGFEGEKKNFSPSHCHQWNLANLPSAINKRLVVAVLPSEKT